MNINCVTRIGTSNVSLSTGDNKIIFSTPPNMNNDFYFYEGFLYSFFYTNVLPQATTNQAIEIDNFLGGINTIPLVYPNGNPVTIDKVKLNSNYVYRLEPDSFRFVLIKSPQSN